MMDLKPCPKCGANAYGAPMSLQAVSPDDTIVCCKNKYCDLNDAMLQASVWNAWSALTEKCRKLSGENDQLRSRLSELENFKPVPEQINALPDPIRKYIHDVETLSDPAGLIQQEWAMREQIAGLVTTVENQRSHIAEVESALRSARDVTKDSTEEPR